MGGGGKGPVMPGGGGGPEVNIQGTLTSARVAQTPPRRGPTAAAGEGCGDSEPVGGPWLGRDTPGETAVDDAVVEEAGQADFGTLGGGGTAAYMSIDGGFFPKKCVEPGAPLATTSKGVVGTTESV
eukprot:scaffold285074_cov21-Prasinocladus_malaysianus.AAC.1